MSIVLDAEVITFQIRDRNVDVSRRVLDSNRPIRVRFRKAWFSRKFIVSMDLCWFEFDTAMEAENFVDDVKRAAQHIRECRATSTW